MCKEFAFSEKFNEYLKESSDDLILDEEVAEDGDFAVEETPESDAPTGGVPTDTPEHSDTNNQVSGVQEGDVIKNDGRYIYHLSKDKHMVYIISATDGKTDIVSEILIPNGFINLVKYKLVASPSTEGESARITSCTCSSVKRLRSSLIRISSAPIPSIGEIKP